MADPLGLISSGGRSPLQGPLSGALGGAAGGRGGVNAEGGEGPSFKDALMRSIEQVNQMQQQASAAQEDLASGARNDVENVILATQKADQAFRALLAVRNRVQAAYEELKQVRV
jgi:flagellar hook-basal body complex protein FliE